MEVNGKLLEELGIKAHQNGFFKQWQHLTSSLKEDYRGDINTAAEEAYKILKTQGSD